jgi:hypothetical protein
MSVYQLNLMVLLTEARNSASCGSILAAAAPAEGVADPTMKPTLTPVLRARETTRPTVPPHAVSLSIAKPLVRYQTLRRLQPNKMRWFRLSCVQRNQLSSGFVTPSGGFNYRVR